MEKLKRLHVSPQPRNHSRFFNAEEFSDHQLTDRTKATYFVHRVILYPSLLLTRTFSPVDIPPLLLYLKYRYDLVDDEEYSIIKDAWEERKWFQDEGYEQYLVDRMRRRFSSLTLELKLECLGLMGEEIEKELITLDVIKSMSFYLLQRYLPPASLGLENNSRIFTIWLYYHPETQEIDEYLDNLAETGNMHQFYRSFSSLPNLKFLRTVMEMGESRGCKRIDVTDQTRVVTIDSGKFLEGKEVEEKEDDMPELAVAKMDDRDKEISGMAKDVKQMLRQMFTGMN